MQFRTDDFTFNSVSLSSFGFKVVNPNASDNTREVGLNRSLSKQTGIGGSYVVDSITQNAPTFPIHISKISDNGEPLEITRNDIYKLNKWLFSPINYKELIATDESGSITYFGMFTSATQTYYDNGVGYITLQFELDSNHGYGIIEETEKIVMGSETFYLNLEDNVSEYYYPDIEFALSSGTSFSISNDTLGEVMEFTNLTSDSNRGRVYGQDMMFVVSLVDDTINMREKSNRKFLKLRQGRNKITITGNGTFKFIVQPKVALQ